MSGYNGYRMSNNAVRAYDKVVIKDTRHNCLEAEWRWLECDKCDVCDIRVCVECGAEVGA